MAEAAEGGSVTERMTLSMICGVDPKKMVVRGEEEGVEGRMRV